MMYYWYKLRLVFFGIAILLSLLLLPYIKFLFKPVPEVISGHSYFPQGLFSVGSPTENTQMFTARLLGKFPIGASKDNLVRTLSEQGFEFERAGLERLCLTAKCKDFGNACYTMRDASDKSGNIWCVHWETGNEVDKIIYMDTEVMYFFAP